MPQIIGGKRRLTLWCAALALGAICPAAASARHSQLAIIQDQAELSAPQQTLARFRALGADTVRIDVSWARLAPRPGSRHRPPFPATDPNAYAASGWAPYDAVVRTARQDGMAVEVTVAGGAPRWAEGAGIPRASLGQPSFAWRPDARAFGQFVHAVGVRYGGRFTPPRSPRPLPAVRLWAIWNEPNFGQYLAPAAIDGSRVSVAPMMYRRLANAGWRALHATGHGRDTILIGELAARGVSGRPTRGHPQGWPGNYGETKPLPFIRTLYCLGSRDRPLGGAAARRVGCPSSFAARRFRTENPGLFRASAVADHPFGDNRSPAVDGNSDPQFAAFSGLRRLARTLDTVNRAYGSRRRYPIDNDEYGYITSPPARRHYVSPATAAHYLNWAEYLSWRNPRIGSYSQYLLTDPPPARGPYAGFATGLEGPDGRPKATYDAYRLPLYLPRTSVVRNAAVEIWGAARPAAFMQRDGHGPQSVAIQLNGRTVRTARPASRGGYLDVRVRFATGGTLRLAYTYPASDPFLPLGVGGSTVHSRPVTLRVGARG